MFEIGLKKAYLRAVAVCVAACLALAVGSSATAAPKNEQGRSVEAVPVVLVQPAAVDVMPTASDIPLHALTGTNDEERVAALPAVVVAAAGWCASGVLGSVATQTLLDILNGKASSKRTYVINAVVGCIVGNFGSWAWRVLPGYLKTRAINAVISFVIYVARR